jgi:hypothetical protein
MTDDKQMKAAPVRVAKKSEGWREREESKAHGVAPRKLTESVRDDEHSLVRC